MLGINVRMSIPKWNECLFELWSQLLIILRLMCMNSIRNR